MLFALLYDDDDQLIAAAPAIDVHSLGNRYWIDVYPRRLGLRPGFQVASIDVTDADLVEKLNSLSLDDIHLSECRAAVDSLHSGVVEKDRHTDRRSPRAA